MTREVCFLCGEAKTPGVPCCDDLPVTDPIEQVDHGGWEDH
jgi:hypothetical protein